MELIRDIIEWIGNEPVPTLATLFPYLVVGLLGLYMLWLLVGYLRVSQVGVAEAHMSQPAFALPEAPAEGEQPTAPRGVPYCAFDGLRYPAGARFCAACERDLVLDCVKCRATLTAGDASCFRCGTRTGDGPALLG
jgi:hypothetical protein